MSVIFGHSSRALLSLAAPTSVRLALVNLEGVTQTQFHSHGWKHRYKETA